MVKIVKILMASITPVAIGIHLMYEKKRLFYPQQIHAAENEMKLEQVQVIFRHGARTPLSNLYFVDDTMNVKESVWDMHTLMKTIPEVDIDYIITLHNGEKAPESHFEKGYKRRGMLLVNAIYLHDIIIFNNATLESQTMHLLALSIFFTKYHNWPCIVQCLFFVEV